MALLRLLPSAVTEGASGARFSVRPPSMLAPSLTNLDVANLSGVWVHSPTFAVVTYSNSRWWYSTAANVTDYPLCRPDCKPVMSVFACLRQIELRDLIFGAC